MVDKFQNLAGLPVVETILSEARKYGLHLVMAHQHTRQLPEELLQSVFSNTGVKVVFRVGGQDLEKLKALDPEFAAELGKVLASLTTGRAVVKRSGQRGEEPPPPALVKMDPPPRRRLSNIGVVDRLPGFAPPPEPREGFDIVSKLNPVLRFLPRERLDPVEAWVLFHVYVATDGGSREELWSNVLVRLGLPRGRADEARNALASRGLLEARREGNRWLVRYSRGLFEGLRSVAPSEEGYRLAREALLYYFQRGYIVYPARQDPGLSARPDLVAIPFDPSSMSLRYDKSVAVEVESCNELSTHPEQAVRNALKHRGVFREVHLWAPRRCRARLLEVLAGVRGKLPLPVRAMPPEEAVEEEAGGVEAGEAGASVAGGGGAGPPRREPGTPMEPPGEAPVEGAVAAEAGQGVGGAVGSPEPGAAGDSSLRRLLEAQAELLAALGRAQARILEAQEKSSEKLEKLLEAVSRMNQLLEKQTQLLERLLEQRSGEDTEPETETPPEQGETPEPRGVLVVACGLCACDS